MSYPQISHFLIAPCAVFTGAAGFLPIFWANCGKQMCDDAPCGRGALFLGRPEDGEGGGAGRMPFSLLLKSAPGPGALPLAAAGF